MTRLRGLVGGLSKAAGRCTPRWLGMSRGSHQRHSLVTAAFLELPCCSGASTVSRHARQPSAGIVLLLPYERAYRPSFRARVLPQAVGRGGQSGMGVQQGPWKTRIEAYWPA